MTPNQRAIVISSYLMLLIIALAVIVFYIWTRA